MAGFCPNEGENFIVDLVSNRNLELGLYTSANTVSESTTEATIIEPTAQGGYARQTLTYASGTVSGDTMTYPEQTFTASGGDFSAPIIGYFICTASAPKKLIQIYPDPALGAGVTFVNGSSYKPIPKITVA